jgi:hypothetical protein
MMILEELGWEGERHMPCGGKDSYPVEGGIFVPNNMPNASTLQYKY